VEKTVCLSRLLRYSSGVNIKHGPKEMTTSRQQAESRPGTAPSMDLGKPPVVETSLGCYFNRIEGWNVLHYGALWSKFRDKYPNPEFQPPVLPTLEPPITFQWAPGDALIPIRALFADARRTQLVQLQADLFLHNWRKTDQTTSYEHYDRILPLFKEDWGVFAAFLQEQGLKRPSLSRCEMSYFNHIVRGEHWQSFNDLPRLFRVWRGFPPGSVFGNIELAAFNVVQAIGKGKVTIVVSPGVRRLDGKEVLQMNVTATRVPEGSEDKDLFAGLDDCHEIALRAFQGFVTDDALLKWEKNR
jgi:uncharacterized protein (TIGR04255 family)